MIKNAILLNRSLTLYLLLFSIISVIGKTAKGDENFIANLYSKDYWENYIVTKTEQIEKDISNFKTEFPFYSVVSVNQHLNEMIQSEIDKKEALKKEILKIKLLHVSI